jgi:type III secretion system FlhB-like substrate exporter
MIMMDKELHNYINFEDIETPGSEPDIEFGKTLLGMERAGFARQAIEAAESKGIQIRSFPDLTNLLFRLELDGVIPREISDTVGELLNWILKLKKIWEMERFRQSEDFPDI